MNKRAAVFTAGGTLVNIIMIVLTLAMLLGSYFIFEYTQDSVTQEIKLQASDLMPHRVMLSYLLIEDQQQEGNLEEFWGEAQGTIGSVKLQKSARPILDKDYCVEDQYACYWIMRKNNAKPVFTSEAIFRVCPPNAESKAYLPQYGKEIIEVNFQFGKCGI